MAGAVVLGPRPGHPRQTFVRPRVDGQRTPGSTGTPEQNGP
jgi:hypothetical protein